MERISARAIRRKETFTGPDIFFQGYDSFTELECTRTSTFHCRFMGAVKPDYLPAAAGGDRCGWLRGTHARPPLRT